MPHWFNILLILCVVALALGQAVIWKRLARLRRRAKRSMLIGPESHLRLQKQLFEKVATLDLHTHGTRAASGLPLEFRSEWGEDTLLYDLFLGLPLPLKGAGGRGVFIEVGALDGRTNSVTWVFEALGWTGLLVEPIPERFEECRACRPGSKVLHAALGPASASGTTRFLVPEQLVQQLSAHRAHEAMNDKHLDALRRGDAKMREVTVPFMSMTRALEQAGLGESQVDFASIDVEGGELETLQGFDLDRFKPRVLVIEDLSLGDDRRVHDYLTSRESGGAGGGGYEHVLWIGANRVFIRSDEPELLRRAKRAAEIVYSPFVRPVGQSDSAGHDLK